ncbi:sel1 repeat family protein [Gammaproteobacteria bacterium]|nr:sel1 repeat family protein [Gammaproteobacteria bacterium]
MFRSTPLVHFNQDQKPEISSKLKPFYNNYYEITPIQRDYNQFLETYNKCNYDNSFKLIKDLYDFLFLEGYKTNDHEKKGYKKDDPIASLVLIAMGVHYFYGFGVNKDKFTAVECFEIGAKQWSLPCVLYLAIIYRFNLLGVKQPEKAFEYNNKFIYILGQNIDASNSNILIFLGKCYLNGNGVEKNIIKALESFYRAANLLNLDAMYILYEIYKTGGFDGEVQIDLQKSKECLNSYKSYVNLLLLSSKYKDSLSIIEEKYDSNSEGEKYQGIVKSLLLGYGSVHSAEPSKKFGFFVDVYHREGVKIDPSYLNIPNYGHNLLDFILKHIGDENDETGVLKPLLVDDFVNVEKITPNIVKDIKLKKEIYVLGKCFHVLYFNEVRIDNARKVIGDTGQFPSKDDQLLFLANQDNFKGIFEDLFKKLCPSGCNIKNFNNLFTQEDYLDQNSKEIQDRILYNIEEQLKIDLPESALFYLNIFKNIIKSIKINEFKLSEKNDQIKNTFLRLEFILNQATKYINNNEIFYNYLSYAFDEVMFLNQTIKSYDLDKVLKSFYDFIYNSYALNPNYKFTMNIALGGSGMRVITELTTLALDDLFKNDLKLYFQTNSYFQIQFVLMHKFNREIKRKSRVSAELILSLDQDFCNIEAYKNSIIFDYAVCGFLENVTTQYPGYRGNNISELIENQFMLRKKTNGYSKLIFLSSEDDHKLDNLEENCLYIKKKASGYEVYYNYNNQNFSKKLDKDKVVSLAFVKGLDEMIEAKVPLSRCDGDNYLIIDKIASISGCTFPSSIKPLTVIIDTTMNTFDDLRLTFILAQYEKHIQSGQLVILTANSLNKYFHMSFDKMPSGLSVGFYKPGLYPALDNLYQKGLIGNYDIHQSAQSLAMLVDHCGDSIIRYNNIIFQNSIYVHEYLLEDTLMDSSNLIKVYNPYVSDKNYKHIWGFVAFQVNKNNFVKNVNLKFLEQNINQMLLLLDINNRDGYGFNLSKKTNINSATCVVTRISIGLETKKELKEKFKYLSDFFTEVNQVAKVLRGRVNDNIFIDRIKEICNKYLSSLNNSKYVKSKLSEIKSSDDSKLDTTNLKSFNEAMESENFDDIYKLAVQYEAGYGVNKDICCEKNIEKTSDEKAIKKEIKDIYDKNLIIAKRGVVDAQYKVAEYLMSDGNDIKEAIEWYKICSFSDHLPSINKLINFYEKCDKSKQDLKYLYKLYEKASNLGDLDAKLKMAVCLKKGEGVKKIIIKANELLKEFPEYEKDMKLVPKIYAKNNNLFEPQVPKLKTNSSRDVFYPKKPKKKT